LVLNARFKRKHLHTKEHSPARGWTDIIAINEHARTADFSCKCASSAGSEHMSKVMKGWTEWLFVLKWSDKGWTEGY
jgi:hypothetical protein